MTARRSYKNYPKEFKEEAVALVLDQGYSVPEAAKSLGITTSLLYKWKDKVEAERDGTALSESERDELKQLRREVKQLRIEKEILKKASVDSIGQRNTHVKILSSGGKLNETYLYQTGARVCL